MNLNLTGALGAALVAVLSIPASANLPPAATSASAAAPAVAVQVGDTIERFPELSGEQKHCHRPGHTPKFIAYYFDPALPSRCVNLQCGRFATQVLAMGGRLVGGADSAFGKEVGINWDVDPRATLLLISDRAGRVRSIYRNVTSQDFPELLTHVDLSR